MKMLVSTAINPELHQLARDEGIQWIKALEFGIQFLVADKLGEDYPQNSLSEKILRMAKVINEQAAIIAERDIEIESLKALNKLKPSTP